MGVLTPAQFEALFTHVEDRVSDRVEAVAAVLAESMAQATVVNILERLVRRSGTLLDSVDAEIKRDGSVLEVWLTVGEDSPAGAYAKVQDEGSGYLPGGVIRPRRAKYLAIPMPIGRGTAGPQSPRDLPEGEVQWVPRQGGGFFVIYGGELLFVLVPEVRLQPTHYAKDAFDEVAKREARRELAAIVEVL